MFHNHSSLLLYLLQNVSVLFAPFVLSLSLLFSFFPLSPLFSLFLSLSLSIPLSLYIPQNLSPSPSVSLSLWSPCTCPPPWPLVFDLCFCLPSLWFGKPLSSATDNPIPWLFSLGGSHVNWLHPWALDQQRPIIIFFLGGGGAVASAHLGGGYAGFCLGIAWCVLLCNIGLHQPFPVPGPHPDPHQTCFAISPKPNPKRPSPPVFSHFCILEFSPPKNGGWNSPPKNGGYGLTGMCDFGGVKLRKPHGEAEQWPFGPEEGRVTPLSLGQAEPMRLAVFFRADIALWHVMFCCC